MKTVIARPIYSPKNGGHCIFLSDNVYGVNCARGWQNHVQWDKVEMDTTLEVKISFWFWIWVWFLTAVNCIHLKVWPTRWQIYDNYASETFWNLSPRNPDILCFRCISTLSYMSHWAKLYRLHNPAVFQSRFSAVTKKQNVKDWPTNFCLLF